MKHPIVAAIPRYPPQRGVLTTEHSSSNYGQAVVVIRGKAYGTTEVLWVDADKETREKANRLGYTTLSDADSRWPNGYEAME